MRNVGPTGSFTINPATKYVVFSQRVSVRSKASERRFSHCEQPPAKAGGFLLRLKAGSIGPAAD
jgi:hypothetical protein